MSDGMDWRQAYDLAGMHHRAGRLAEADALYRQVLAAQPAHVGTLQSLAQLLFQVGDHQAAAVLLERATRIDPQSSQLHANLGIVLAAKGRLDDAIARLRHALTLKPDAPEILVNLAGALKTKGAFSEAIETYRRAISIRPDDATAHFNLAGALKDVGDLDGAVVAYQRAAALRPDFVEAQNDLGNVLYLTRRFAEAIDAYGRAIAIRPDDADAPNNLAISLQETGRLQEAEAACSRAIVLRPNFPEAYYNLGRILQDQRRQAEAADAYRHALALRPAYVEARSNLAMTLQAQGRLDEAIATYRHVLAIRPDYADALVNLGVGLKQLGQVADSVEHYDRVLATRPDLLEARWNLGVSLLLGGDYARGWEAHESRRQIPRLNCNRRFAQPEWRGEPLNGRRILLYVEQGFGDVIHFIRYAQMVRERGGTVIVQCQPGLKRLLSGQLGIETVVSDVEPLPSFDLHCPLLTLPFIFGTTLTSIPCQVPYLHADPKMAERWRARLQDVRGRLNVGIAWAGNPAHPNDRERSLPAPSLAPLAQAQNVRFISLQKFVTSARAEPAPGNLNATDFTSELADFADTAALVANLDLVISGDTAVAHLAGAMGKRVWLLAPFSPDWRWMLGRSDSPWYPTMRLFRQPRWGDWKTPLEHVAAELPTIALPART